MFVEYLCCTDLYIAEFTSVDTKMFGKGHFEGDFRTKPVVSIRGATKAESKTELLRRAHKDRLDREVNNINPIKKGGGHVKKHTSQL